MRFVQVVPRTLVLPSAAFALLAFSSVIAFAENVPVSLTLVTPANPDTNRGNVDFSIDIAVPAFSQTESDSTDISGTLATQLDIDFAPGTHEATVNTISFSPGSIALTDMSVTFNVSGVGSLDIDTSSITGYLDSPGGSSAVGPTGDFAAGDHRAVLNAGTISATPAVIDTIDLSLAAVMELLDAGTANVAVTKSGLPVGLDQTYDVMVTVPFQFSSTRSVILDTPLGDVPADETFAMTTGNLVATGQFVHTVPEPASILLSAIGAVLAIFLVRRM